MSRPNYFGESFANVQKMKMTQSSCSFCLELKSENWSWRLHMRVTNLHVSSVCRPSLCVYPLGETITPPTWAANALVVPTNILLLCYARSCFLQQEISTLWPNSSKHLLCPLISSVYHPLLPLSHIILVQHFANVLSSLDRKEILRSHFCTFGLHCHNVLFLVSSQPQVVPFAVPDLFGLMSGSEQDGHLWWPEITNKRYSANVALKTNRWLLNV